LSDVYVAWHCRAVILTVYLFSPLVKYQPPNETPIESAYPAGERHRKISAASEGGKTAARTAGIQGKCCLQTYDCAVPSGSVTRGPTG